MIMKPAGFESLVWPLDQQESQIQLRLFGVRRDFVRPSWDPIANQVASRPASTSGMIASETGVDGMDLAN